MKIMDHCIVNDHNTTFLKISKKSKFHKFSQNLKKHKFALISETVIDRGKRSELLNAKLQIFEIFSFLIG